MTGGSFRFEEFRLDPADRQLRRGGETVELNGRYFDALELLVRNPGKLVTKDRFMDEVWRGIPVTDEALTQCIRTIRRQLGDEAGRPRFIETVPKHGYRFIAPVEGPDSAGAAAQLASGGRVRDASILAAAGTAGGAFAGLLGGLFYGFAVSSGAIGSASAVVVLVCLTMLVALLGAAGVSGAIAVAGPRSRWTPVAGAAGGLVVGAVVKLLAADSFALLVGQAPGDVTGAPEGALLGAAVGLGAWLGWQSPTASLERRAAIGALTGGIAGAVIPLLGGRLFAGSLDLVAQTFPDSQLQLDQLGALFGESGVGPIAQIVTGGMEGALFGGCLLGAMELAERLRDQGIGSAASTLQTRPVSR